MKKAVGWLSVLSDCNRQHRCFEGNVVESIQPHLQRPTVAKKKKPNSQTTSTKTLGECEV